MINKKVILLDTKFQTKMEVLEEYCNISEEAGLVGSKDDFLKALLERERFLSTSIGDNIAIPHCQSETIHEPFVGFVRNINMIPWDENEMVNLMFVIAIPKKASGQIHLQTLAKLSRKLMHQEFVKKLLHSTLDESFNILRTTLEEE